MEGIKVSLIGEAVSAYSKMQSQFLECKGPAHTMIYLKLSSAFEARIKPVKSIFKTNVQNRYQRSEIDLPSK